MKYKELTEKIIGCAYRVYNRMGYGSFSSLHFLEVGSCLVPMLQRGNPLWYAFPRWSMGTRKFDPNLCVYLRKLCRPRF